MAATPLLYWGHSALQGHLRLAAVIVTEHNGLNASAPGPAQSAPRGAPQLQPTSWGVGDGGLGWMGVEAGLWQLGCTLMGVDTERMGMGHPPCPVPRRDISTIWGHGEPQEVGWKP